MLWYRCCLLSTGNQQQHVWGRIQEPFKVIPSIRIPGPLNGKRVKLVSPGELPAPRTPPTSPTSSACRSLGKLSSTESSAESCPGVRQLQRVTLEKRQRQRVQVQWKHMGGQLVSWGFLRIQYDTKGQGWTKGFHSIHRLWNAGTHANLRRLYAHILFETLHPKIAFRRTAACVF